MKLTIWQQFSSNHSAGFSLVGTFATPEDAQRAADEINRLLAGLREWYSDEERLTEMLEARYKLENDLTTLEKDFAKKYGIPAGEWTYYGGGIDWVSAQFQYAGSPLDVVDRYIFISVSDITWQGSGPLRPLLEKLGATVTAAESDYSYIVVNINCEAPDEQTARSLKSMLKPNEWDHIAIDDAHLWEGKVSVEGTHITITDGRLPDEIDIFKVVTALERRGCTNIQFQFKQIPS